MRIGHIRLGLLAALGCASAHPVTIDTQPSGAAISLDGRPLGLTPVTFTDRPSDGRYYRIDLSMPGYRATQKVLKQEEQKSTVIAAGCCPPARICLLWSSVLPSASYTFQLVPDFVPPPPPVP